MKTKAQLLIQSITLAGLANMFGKGRFATVSFVKQDGTTRILNGKTLVKRGINGNGSNYDAKSNDQLRVFDVNARDANGKRVGGYRTVTVNRVTDVRSNGVIYKIARDPAQGGSFVGEIKGDASGAVVELSGVKYRYFGVPATLVLEWQKAESKGTFYNERIKPFYAFNRLG